MHLSRRRLVLLFVASRAIAHLLGVRFDMNGLASFYQLLDVDLLRHDLLRSVLALHSQPPLFNLFVGALLKLPEAWTPIAFEALYHLFGLALALSLLSLLDRLDVPSPAALAVTLAFSLAPAAILYESWFFYGQILATALAAGALFFHRFASTGRLADGLACFGALAAVVLTASFYHLALAVTAALLLGMGRPKIRTGRLVLALLPLTLPLAWYARNAHLYSSPAASTWLGMNAARVIVPKVPRSERQRLAREGRVSELVLHQPFSPLEALPERFRHVPPAGEPALDQRTKSTGHPNFNNLAYVGISRQLGRDAVTLVRAYPWRYAQGVVEAFYLFFLPTSDYSFLDGNRARFGPASGATDLVLAGRLISYPAYPTLRDRSPVEHAVRMLLSVAWFAAALYAFVLVAGARLAAHLSNALSTPTGTTLVFLWLTLAYTLAVGTLLELGENNRFRFVAEPVAMAAAAGFLSRGVSSTRSAGPTWPSPSSDGPAASPSGSPRPSPRRCS